MSSSGVKSALQGGVQRTVLLVDDVSADKAGELERSAAPADPAMRTTDPPIQMIQIKTEICLRTAQAF